MLIPALAGQDLTPEFFNASIDNAGKTLHQAADQIRNNSTTYLDSTSLVFPLVASAGYTFAGTFFYTSPTTPDIKIQIRGPSGCFIRCSFNAADLEAEDDVGDMVERAFGTSGSLEAIQPSGFVSTDTTAGNLIVAFAQNTANASDTILEQGSFLTLRRVL